MGCSLVVDLRGYRHRKIGSSAEKGVTVVALTGPKRNVIAQIADRRIG